MSFAGMPVHTATLEAAAAGRLGAGVCEWVLLSLVSTTSHHPALTPPAAGAADHGVGNSCKARWGDGVTCPCLLHGVCWVPLPAWLLVDRNL